MRRFVLWGQENAMVEDPDGPFVLWADVAPILEKDRTQKNEEPVVIGYRACQYCGSKSFMSIGYVRGGPRVRCAECKATFDEI